MFLSYIKINQKKRNITFEQISNEWLEIKRKTLKKSTVAIYSYSIKKYLFSSFQKINLKQLEKYDYNDFVEKLDEEYAPKTIRDIIVILKAILRYAEEEYNCHMKLHRIVLPKLDSEPLSILSKNERTKLEKYCAKENSLKSIGIVICLNTGMRIGEMCALKWENIDLEKREIHIRSTLQRIYNEELQKTEVIIDTPKSKKSVRNIPISNKIYEMLKPIKGVYKPEDFFLTGSNKEYVEPISYRNAFKKILKKSKIKTKYKFHILRHIFATFCIGVGMDTKSLSELLGHASVEITLNKYVHSSHETKIKYLEKL